MIAIYHNRNFLEFMFEKFAIPLDLIPVAYIDANDLDEAYRLTNSIDCHWSHNNFLWIHEKAKNASKASIDYCRSTSVGDVMFVSDGNTTHSIEQWPCFVVASCGFEPLPQNATIIWNQ